MSRSWGIIPYTQVLDHNPGGRRTEGRGVFQRNPARNLHMHHPLPNKPMRPAKPCTGDGNSLQRVGALHESGPGCHRSRESWRGNLCGSHQQLCRSYKLENNGFRAHVWRRHRHIHEPGTFVLPHSLRPRKPSQSYVRTTASHTFLYRRTTFRLRTDATDSYLDSDVERSVAGHAGDADAVKKKIIVEEFLTFRGCQSKRIHMSLHIHDSFVCSFFAFASELFPPFLFSFPACVCLHPPRTVDPSIHGPWLAVVDNQPIGSGAMMFFRLIVMYFY